MNNLISHIKNTLNTHHLHIASSILTSCLIFIATWYVNKLLQKGISKFAAKSNLDKSVIMLFHNVTSIAAYLIAGFLILANLNLQASLLLKIVGLLSVGAGLALQKIIGNIAAGMFVLIYKPFTIGDFISCNHPNSKFEGKIINIDLRTTTLEYENSKVLIPNQILYETVVTVITSK